MEKGRGIEVGGRRWVIKGLVEKEERRVDREREEKREEERKG